MPDPYIFQMNNLPNYCGILRLTNTIFVLPNKPNTKRKLLQDNIKYRKDLYLYRNINRGLTKYQIRDLNKLKRNKISISNQEEIVEQYYSKKLNREIIKYSNGNIITRLPKLSKNAKNKESTNEM